MRLKRLRKKLAAMLLVSAILPAAQSQGQLFSVSEDFNVFESDLAKVYGRWGAPDFDQLDWCLTGANSGFAFLYCNGLEYSIIFDSESYLAGKDSADLDTDYRVLNKLDEDKVVPSMIQDLTSVGDALTVISKKQEGEGQVLFIMYREKTNEIADASASSADSKMIIGARRANFAANQQVLSAWGNDEFLLYHAFSERTGQEDIIVYYFKNELDQGGKSVTDLNLYQIPERPQNTELIYDVIQTSEDEDGRDNYTIYVVAKYSDLTDPSIWTQTLYEHDIDRSGTKKDLIKRLVELNDICVDQIKVRSKLITAVCAETKQIAFIDREKMELIQQDVIALPESEAFTRVQNFGEKSATGGGAELIFKSEFMQTLDREGHTQVFLTTYDSVAGLFKLQSVEIIVHTYEEKTQFSTQEAQTVFASLAPTEILQSSEQMHLLQMSDSSVTIFTEGQSQKSSTLPVCFLDQYLGPDGLTCEQCPLGAYGLSPQRPECNSCAYLNGDILEPHLTEKLQFLCDNKIGQISSPNRGVYAAQDYPSKREFAVEWREILISLGIDPVEDESSPIIDQETISISDGDGQEDDGNGTTQDGESGTEGDGETEGTGQDQDGKETGEGAAAPSDQNSSSNSQGQVTNEDTDDAEDKEEEPAISSLVSILISTLGVIFLVPWIIIAIVQIRKRVRRNNIQKQKDFQQQQMLKITDYGREIRRAARGPQGEPFNDPDGREARFRKVDKFAPEHLYKDCKDIKKSQTTCAICVEDFVDKDLTRMTNCNHLFHSQCLMMWAKSKIWANPRRMGSPCCPNCNASLISLTEPTTVQDAPLLGTQGQRNQQQMMQQQQQQLEQGGDHDIILLNNNVPRTDSINSGRLNLVQYQSANYMNAQSIDQFGHVNHQMQNVAIPVEDYIQNEMMSNQLMMNSNELLEAGNQVIANLSDDGIQIVRTLNQEEAMQLGLINHNRAVSLEQQSRRAMSQRDFVPPQTLEPREAEDGNVSDFANRSLPAQTTQAVQPVVAKQGWATLQKYPAHQGVITNPIMAVTVPNRNSLQQQTPDKMMGVSMNYNSMKRNRHLEVISEDEGAMQHLGTNRKILEQVAANTRAQMDNQDSDGSSTNVYLQRKQRILEALNKQNQQMSDGYASITEQPIFAQIDDVSRISRDQQHQSSNEVLPSIHHHNTALAALQQQQQHLHKNPHQVIAVTTMPKKLSRGASNKVYPIFQPQHVLNSYLSSDDQSFTPGMVALPPKKDMRLRTVVNGKESGYVSSTTNPKKPHMMAVENMSQGPQPAMHSDLESIGSQAFGIKSPQLRNNDQYIPGGARSVSVRGDLNKNSNMNVNNQSNNNSNNYANMQHHVVSAPQSQNQYIPPKSGKGSMRSMALMNQGAFAIGVGSFSVARQSRDYAQAVDTDGQSQGQSSARNVNSAMKLRNKLDKPGSSMAVSNKNPEDYKQAAEVSFRRQSHDNNHYEVASGPTVSVHNQGNIHADHLSVTSGPKNNLVGGPNQNEAGELMTEREDNALNIEQESQPGQEEHIRYINDGIDKEIKQADQRYLSDNDAENKSKDQETVPSQGTRQRAVITQRSQALNELNQGEI